MICPNCLSNNSKTALVCKKCGCPLDDIKSDQQYSEYKPKSNKPTINENLRYTVKEVVANDIEYDSFDSEPTENIIISPVRTSANTNRSRTSVSGKSGVYPSEKIKTHKVRRTVTMIVTIILWLAIIGGIVFGLYYAGNAILNAINQIQAVPTPAPVKTPNTPDVAIMTDNNGTQYINCKFSGNDGDSVLIEQLNERFNIVNGVAEINIYLSDLLPPSSAITEDTVPVTIKAKYRFADGNESSMSLPTVEFTIPETKISILSATSKSIEVFKDKYKIVLAVPTGSNLYINDAISNDKLDSSGRIEYTVDILPGDSKSVRFKVQAPYHKVSEALFTIYRQSLNTNFILSNSNVTTTNTNTIKITGLIDPGTEITCDDKYEISNFTYNANNKTFTMNIKLPNYGLHDILLTATDITGSKTAKLTHTVNYLPDETQYTTKAWAYESNVSKNYKQYLGKSFLFSQVQISEFILAENKTFVINMGTQENPEFIYVEYTGPLSLNTTTKYRIFGDVIGQKDGKTLVAARYIYNW